MSTRLTRFAYFSSGVFVAAGWTFIGEGHTIGGIVCILVGFVIYLVAP